MDKTERLTQTIKEAVAAFLQKESSGSSLLTITSASISPDRRQALIYLSVLPEDKERPALEFANRKAEEARTFLKKKTRLAIIPRISFELDQGEKHRQKIDSLLSQEDIIE